MTDEKRAQDWTPERVAAMAEINKTLVDRQTRIVELEAEVKRLGELATEAVKAARLFNRNGMTWMEYDRLLARIEREASDIPAPRVAMIRLDERRRIADALRHHGHSGGGTAYYEAAEFIERMPVPDVAAPPSEEIR